MKYYIAVTLDGEEHEFEYDNFIDALTNAERFEDEGYAIEFIDENGNEY